MRRLVAAVFVLSAAIALHAQQPTVPALALGNAPGSWVADVATTGGFTGRGAGSISVRSDGAAACAMPLRCDATIATGRIATLTDTLDAARRSVWQRPPSRSVCNDCIVTTLTIRTRLTDGSESRTVFTWDNAEAPQLPAAVHTFYDDVIAVGRR